jgi:hypothetical protein
LNRERSVSQRSGTVAVVVVVVVGGVGIIICASR